MARYIRENICHLVIIVQTCNNVFCLTQIYILYINVHLTFITQVISITDVLILITGQYLYKVNTVSIMTCKGALHTVGKCIHPYNRPRIY